MGGKRLDDGDSDDDNGSKRGDESHEMAAFMRMFMDLVGIFNEDQSLCEDGKIPAAGKSRFFSERLFYCPYEHFDSSNAFMHFIRSIFWNDVWIKNWNC